ncbi:MAG: 2-C-methyl-D-erythritol 2,4-cyclodiphosphate synthase [Ignavibacteria bacterium]
MSGFRVGIGFDVHKFDVGRKLILGGVEIPSDKGLEGHSDADVLLHAICDALLGAAALGDIGKHFPNTDDRYKNISSLILLEKTNELIASQNYVVANIDSTIIAERPKLLPYIEEMREKISGVLKIDKSQISVKATTSEKLGFTGREEGIVAMAVALIYTKNSVE